MISYFPVVNYFSGSNETSTSLSFPPSGESFRISISISNRHTSRRAWAMHSHNFCTIELGRQGKRYSEREHGGLLARKASASTRVSMDLPTLWAPVSSSLNLRRINSSMTQSLILEGSIGRDAILTFFLHPFLKSSQM
ncbi:hypothetical protein ACMFMF_008848 [Clarireedia jacksonii]